MQIQQSLFMITDMYFIQVCYYGTKASDENGFFDEKHPDFPAGKRFIITHLAAAYANGSSDWASGTNATGKNLAMELYNYCVNMPDIPSVDMSFSESNVKAYVEGNSQRTSVITFKADKLQTITFKLPSGVKLVNVSTGKTSAAGASVEISGGTQFYLTAPLDQAESVSATFSSQMKQEKNSRIRNRKQRSTIWNSNIKHETR